MDSQQPRRDVYLEAGKAILADLPLSMVLTDPNRPDNPIVYVNRAFEQMTGYAASYAVGRNCRFLQANGQDQQAEVAELARAIRAHEPTNVVLRNSRLDGSTFLNRLMISPVADEEGQIYAFVGIQTEVVEDRPEQSEVLPIDDRLDEMQHRVKNHLQMISSLIRMQRRGGDPVDSYGTLSRRVDALALLYEEFQQPPRPGDVRYDVVSAGGYVSRVASTVASLDGRRNVRVGVDVDPVYMRTERAAQIGLLTSEVLSNTLRHAFDGRPEGMVTVSLKQHGGDRVRLIVSDDGVGLGDVDWPRQGNLGANIVRSLAQGLDAELGVVTSDNGTVVTMDIDNPVDTSLETDGTRILTDKDGSRSGGALASGLGDGG